MEETGSGKDFLFVGSPLLDLRAGCSRETLERYGLKSDDCIRETEEQEALFRSLLAEPDSLTCAGGSSQNTARVAKWILADKGRVSFAGCVGEDDYAITMSECLESEGVDALYLPLSGQSTGVCACLLSSEGDRSMIARLGAAEHFAEHHLREERVLERVRRANCVFVEGYFFGHSPGVMLALAETCSEDQVLSISLSAEYICRDHADTVSQVLPRVDVLFGNEAEAKALAEALHFEGRSANLGDLPLQNPDLFGGDMLGVEVVDRNVIPDPHRRWPRKAVPYVIDSGIDSYKELILSAMREYEDKTCIRFEPRKLAPNYIRLFAGQGCYSMVGMVGGQQQVSLGQGCMFKGIIIHELGHAVGFFHEHNRSDRDEYLVIYWENIQRGMENQFLKMSPDQNTLLSGFDYDSIMLYSNVAFSYNDRDYTMAARSGVPLLEQWEKPGLSRSDVYRLNKMYNC